VPKVVSELVKLCHINRCGTFFKTQCRTIF